MTRFLTLAELAPIEPGIQPVCDALNAIHGVKTLWSCEGHPDRPSPPYVTFQAPQETAFLINTRLDVANRDGLLDHGWWLVANFRVDGSLQYTMKPNDYRLVEQARCWLLRAFWQSKGWGRRRMDNELAKLADLLVNDLTK